MNDKVKGRDIEEKLKEMATKFPLLAITGPRQSGKTTLCKKLFSNYRYVTLENPDNREFAISDPKGFLNLYDKNVIFDEIQNTPSLFSYIQERVDASGLAGHYILTGLENSLLLKELGQTLAERVYIFNLLPFSQHELGKDLSNNVHQNIFKGGYPRIYDKDIDPTDYFPSFMLTYLEGEVRNTLKVGNIYLFNAFLKLCAGGIGQLFKASNISNELGVDYKTIQKWLSLLEASFVLYRLPPWHTNFSKRIVKTPKLYFYDTGLACHLLGLRSAEDLETHFSTGALFENYVITDHIKNTWNRGMSNLPYFWRDSSGNEIDLLIEDGKRLKTVEIKSAQTIKLDFFKHLNRFEKLAESKFEVNKKLIYGGQDSYVRSGVDILSWRDLGEI